MVPAVTLTRSSTNASLLYTGSMDVKLPHEIVGRVLKYKGNGRKLGYPTANIDSDTDLRDGVYFGFADLDTYANQATLIFIGTPTTMGDTQRRVEAHVLDINDVDYYGSELRLRLEQFHRSNQTFDSVEKLMVAMKADELAGREWVKGLQRVQG